MYTHPLVQTVFAHLQPFAGSTPLHFLLACSGGADSTALLFAFYELQPLLPCKLTVVTVNHNIRSAAESAGDADFVTDLCRRLNITCFAEELPRGAVTECALQRGRGIEDAARVLRYGILEKIADSIHADFIVTAHNRNDSYETALMRLFQGGGTAGLRTMPFRRGRYLRPLITADRSGIESFLNRIDAGWREDSTNAEDSYLRNRIRHFLVPVLDRTFGAWQSGLDKTLQRIALDRSFCDSALETARQHCTNGGRWQLCKHGAVTLDSAFFYSLHPALRLRLIEQGCRLLRVRERIPFGVLHRMTEDVPQGNVVAAGGIRLELRGSLLLLFKDEAYYALYNQKNYVLHVPAAGVYHYPLGVLEVYRTETGFFVKDSEDQGCGIGPFQLPVLIRGRRIGDRIRMKNGNSKEIKKIINEWSMDSLARELLPIIIADNCLRALYGSPLGYKDWFVEERQ